MTKFDEDLLKQIREKYGLPEVEATDVAYLRELKWNQSNKHMALINPDSGKLFGIHSNNYRLAKHEEGMILLNNAIENNPEFGKPEWTVDLYDEGRKAKITAKFPEVEFPVTNKVGDIINPTLEYLNSYDGTWAEKVILGAYRLICKNGLTVGKKFFMERVIHVGQDRPNQFLTGLDKALDNFSMQVDLWKLWADKQLDPEQGELALEPFGKKQREEIMTEVRVEERQNNLSLWIFYNILTAYITHHVKSLNRRVALQSGLRKVTEEWG